MSRLSSPSAPFEQGRALPASFALAKLAHIWQERYVTRRALSRMDANELDDIGLCSLRAAQEAAKPFWRA